MADNSAGSDSSSPRKRLKTAASTQIQSSKRKSPLEDEPYQHQSDEIQPPAENSAPRNCAICFLEDGKAVRGEIDCCNHYFCFLCIMEWSKTETRCPMCRRRFGAIRRPPKEGVFAGERLIKVPVRDQALHYGDTTGSFDPYAEVLCNVCHTTRDECLLLLCDLCDSASHTYCVGLGYTVPEGDWYCHDCTISRAEHANCETNKEEDDQHATMASSLPNVVRQESHGPVGERRPWRVSSDSSRVSPRAAPHRRVIATDEATGPRARAFPNVAKKLTESGARTLGRCRSVQSRIKALRENWNALRSGSLSFSSGSSEPRCYSHKHENNAVLDGRSGHVASSSAKSSQQSENKDTVGSNDIDRAWKMFDVVKSKHCARGKTSGLQSSKLPPSKASGSKQRTNVSSKERMEKPLLYCSVGKEIKKHQWPSRCSTKVASGCSSNLSTTRLPRSLEPSLSKNTNSVGGNTSKKDRSISLEESASRASGQQRPAGKVSQEVSDTFDTESELSPSSVKVDFPNGRIRVNNGGAGTNVRTNDDAKSEIQSLVKLNLKLLSRDKQLGVAAFKEIARAATHTILAACGLEHHKKYGIYSFSSFKCSHDGFSEQIARSNIMPTSCEQCFCGFVKDIVNSVMSEKVGSAKLS